MYALFCILAFALESIQFVYCELLERRNIFVPNKLFFSEVLITIGSEYSKRKAFKQSCGNDTFDSRLRILRKKVI